MAKVPEIIASLDGIKFATCSSLFFMISPLDMVFVNDLLINFMQTTTISGSTAKWCERK